MLPTHQHTKTKINERGGGGGGDDYRHRYMVKGRVYYIGMVKGRVYHICMVEAEGTGYIGTGSSLSQKYRVYHIGMVKGRVYYIGHGCFNHIHVMET